MTTPKTPLRILVVDDHPAVRLGLAMLLETEAIQVCAEAEGTRDALERLGESQPDVAVVDLSLEGESGIPLIGRLLERGVNTLVYSMHYDAHRVSAAFAAGALGYVTKREVHGILVQAIRSVAAGHRFVSPKAAAALAESVASNSPGGTAVRPLSPKEREVYRLLGEGLNAPEIGDALGISEHTAGTYFARLQDKLNLDNMRELRRHAIGASRNRGEPPE